MPAPDRDNDAMSAFTRLLSQDIGTLREWVAEVIQEIESRKELRRELASKLEDGMEKVQLLIDEIDHWKPDLGLIDEDRARLRGRVRRFRAR
jgi:hypothetical protein